MLERSVPIVVSDAQHSRHVLPQRPPQPSTRQPVHDADVVGEQLRLAMLQAGPLARHRETLAGRPARQDIHRLNLRRVQIAHIRVDRHTGEAGLEHLPGVPIPLAHPRHLTTQPGPRQFKPADAGEQPAEPHAAFPAARRRCEVRVSAATSRHGRHRHPFPYVDTDGGDDDSCCRRPSSTRRLKHRQQRIPPPYGVSPHSTHVRLTPYWACTCTGSLSVTFVGPVVRSSCL